MILLSACLLGVKCRYDKKDAFDRKAYEFYKNNDCILLCPEVLGGLDIPRPECEILNNKVINKYGKDKTDNFVIGAQKALIICKKLRITKAVLKDNSPSCGVRKIYDGTFLGRKIEGMGFTARLLKENGICVLSEKDI